MKQLRPRTILAIGLPLSLLLNICVVSLVFWSSPFIGIGETDWWGLAVALAGSVWILLSVPTLVGMAVIRGRIGKSGVRQRKIRAAIRCCGACLAVTVLGACVGYMARSQEIFNLPILAIVSVFVGAIGATLALLTGVNMLVRSFTNEWGSRST